jgi:hypothetical protein
MPIIPAWAVGTVVVVGAISLASFVLAIARKAFHLPRTTMPGNSGPEVAELREAFEAMQQRMQELEERVDFSERALLKQREADRSESPRR